MLTFKFIKNFSYKYYIGINIYIYIYTIIKNKIINLYLPKRNSELCVHKKV